MLVEQYIHTVRREQIAKNNVFRIVPGNDVQYSQKSEGCAHGVTVQKEIVRYC